MAEEGGGHSCIQLHRLLLTDEEEVGGGRCAHATGCYTQRRQPYLLDAHTASTMRGTDLHKTYSTTAVPSTATSDGYQGETCTVHEFVTPLYTQHIQAPAKKKEALPSCVYRPTLSAESLP